MRMIPTRIHGFLDYSVSVLMIAAPWIFDFAAGGAETWIFVILGAGAIAYSLFTNYELGISKGISMRTHLLLDTLSGVLLAASPWIFGFADYVWTPHVIFGLLEIGVALFTRREPLHGPRENTHHRTEMGHF
jgi:hypothetical protein